MKILVRKKQMKKLMMIGLLGAVLAGCGGGDGDSNDSSSDNNNRRPSAAQGTIERVSGNSIMVNGHQYDVASVSYRAGGATVELDATQLQSGMLVALSASPTRAAGQHVQLDPTITGIINITNKEAGQFTVNGVALTFSELSALVDQGHIQDGSWVMVSSLPTATDGYKVLSVVKFDDFELQGIFEVEGTVSNLDSDHRSFNLGAVLTVDYSNVDDSGAHAQLSNGLWVEVEGKYDNANAKINATEIEIETYDDIDNDTEIEGLVTWVANDKSAFELNYRGRFTITSQTRFEDGTQSQLNQGVMVEVTTGTNNIALEVEFDNDDNDTGDWSNNDIDMTGVVTALDRNSNSFTIKNKEVFINRFTEFDDGLSFDTIETKTIEVEAYKVNNQLIASEIELQD